MATRVGVDGSSAADGHRESPASVTGAQPDQREEEDDPFSEWRTDVGFADDDWPLPFGSARLGIP